MATAAHPQTVVNGFTRRPWVKPSARGKLTWQLLENDLGLLYRSQFTKNHVFIMIGYLLILMLLLSPTLSILWTTINRVGFIWSLLFIPLGAMTGFFLWGVGGAYFYTLLIWLEDRQTGSPEAGAIGAATGRAIVEIILMILFGWIGSGFSAWWVASHWVS